MVLGEMIEVKLLEELSRGTRVGKFVNW
jgi:hypothetical protein